MAIPLIANLPKEAAAALEQFAENLTTRLGANLVGIFLYGGVARGTFNEGSSNLNLLVVLREHSVAALTEIRTALPRKADAHLSLMTLTESELAECVEVFAIKFQDIQCHHILLCGRDVLTPLVISEERLVRQARRELVNLKLRVRQTFVFSGGDERLASMLERAAKTARINAGVLENMASMERAVGLLRESLAALEGTSPPEERCGAFLPKLEQAIQALGPV